MCIRQVGTRASRMLEFEDSSLIRFDSFGSVHWAGNIVERWNILTICQLNAKMIQ